MVATHKHGSICRNVGEGIIHVIDAAVVHHPRRRTAIDLVVREVDGVGVHDVRDASGPPPPGRRETHDGVVGTSKDGESRRGGEVSTKEGKLSSALKRSLTERGCPERVRRKDPF